MTNKIDNVTVVKKAILITCIYSISQNQERRILYIIHYVLRDTYLYHKNI